MKVVSEDEREAGLRAILNFGHTFGHAIEHVAGYGHYTHGEAVILGMQAALYLSARLHPASDFAPAAALLDKLPILAEPKPLSLDALIDATYSDKKTEAGKVRFVLLDHIGHAYIENNASMEDAREAFKKVLKSS